MAKARKQKPKRQEKAQVIPDCGLVRVLDRELQKQLDDLNEMKKVNSGLSRNGRNGKNKS
jgi:hypothetical protein